MTKVELLMNLFSASDYKRNYTIAKSRNTCILCGESAQDFKDQYARLEYSISGLCQSCQDEYLNGKNQQANLPPQPPFENRREEE